MKDIAQDNLLQMGKITGVHGVKGALKLAVYAEAPEEIFASGKTVKIATRLESQFFTIQNLVPHGAGFLLFLNGITTRTAAEALIGGQIKISRSELPELEEDTYYWHDLIGLQVKTEDDKNIGRLQSIIETGSNDVYVIREGKKERLLPALESVILSVDIKAGQMTVKIPEGLEGIN